jgi:hypothetical protein
MATDPKWAALRKWLLSEDRRLVKLYDQEPTLLGRTNIAGARWQTGRMLIEMRRLSRQRPKTGAKQR